MTTFELPVVTRGQRLTGRILSGLAAAFLLLDGVMKLVQPAVVVDTTVRLGFPEHTIAGIGVSLLIGTVLYLIPRTALLGALLVTAFLGGAVATHVRVGNPLFSHLLFPVYVAAFVWAGLYLRDAWLRVAIGHRTRRGS